MFPAAPPFVNVLIGVSMGSATVTLPTPTNVRVGVPEDASKALPESTLNVSVSASLPTDAFAPSNTAPARELLFVPVASRLRNAPKTELPVPEIVSGSPITRPAPLTCSSAPDATSVRSDDPADPPSDELSVTTTTPAEIVVIPE